MEQKNDILSKSKEDSIFRHPFFVDLFMFVFPINIILLIYWKVKKDKKMFDAGMALFLAELVFLSIFVAALCTVFKTSPVSLVKSGISAFQNIPSEIEVNKNGYLEVGGRMLQISSEKGMTLSFDKEKVVLYSADKETHLVLYEDSGIEVGSLSDEELKEEMKIEKPEDYFDSYDEQAANVAEKLGINQRNCYVTYTQGYFKNEATETEEELSGAYTEVYILQDVGAKTYLSIRVADYEGEAPSVLVGKYALTMVKTIA